MTTQELENLLKIGRLKAEPATRAEFDGLVQSARRRLGDARIESLADESRFDLAYNAAHALAPAALRHKGYRSDNRYVVFQTLAHTAGLDAAIWRVLARAHDLRNRAEYEGRTEVDARFLADLLRCATGLETSVAGLEPPPNE